MFEEQMREGYEVVAVETEAIQTKLHIEQLAQRMKGDAVMVGALLLKARNNCHWSTLGYESFKGYVEDLDFPVSASYSWATRLMGVAQMVADQLLTAQDVDEMGVSKAIRLLPAANRGEDITEWIVEAKVLSERDLRLKMAGKDDPEIPTGRTITCWNCGATIMVGGKHEGS